MVKMIILTIMAIAGSFCKQRIVARSLFGKAINYQPLPSYNTSEAKGSLS
jgi:hypothetical protein